jgi:hypothetical protein
VRLIEARAGMGKRVLHGQASTAVREQPDTPLRDRDVAEHCCRGNLPAGCSPLPLHWGDGGYANQPGTQSSVPSAVMMVLIPCRLTVRCDLPHKAS